MTADLTIQFPNQECLYQFAIWLCESGEQQYWGWLEERPEYSVDFHYHSPHFMDTNVITTTPSEFDPE